MAFREFLISLWVGTRMALVEMASHKLRSFLSMLGVLLGVASLVVLLMLIGGIDVFLNEKMSRWVGSVWIWENPNPPEEEKIAWSRSPGMHFSDGEHLEEHSSPVKRHVKRITREGEVILAGADYHRTRIKGMDEPTMVEEHGLVRIAAGRWILPEEFDKGAKVCVVSWDLLERLARDLPMNSKRAEPDSVLGEILSYRGVPLRVVGVYEPLDPDTRPWMIRRSVVVPLLTMREHISGYDPNPGNLEIQIEDVQKVQSQAEQVAADLRLRHRDVEDFTYHTSEWLTEVTQVLKNASVLMGVLSVLSLFVGGLGIMNVMLSSITERLQEIGVRKALGATNVQIFAQFLAETLTLSLVGGFLGSALGSLVLLFGEAIKKSTQGSVEPVILPQHVLLVLVIIVMVGVVFGLYPAWKASRMNPIEALRYE